QLYVRAVPVDHQSLVVVVYGNRKDLFGTPLSNDIFVQIGHHLAGAGHLAEQFIRRASSAIFLVEDRFTKLDTLTTDVNIAGPFNERSHLTVAFAAKRAEGVLLVRATSAGSTDVISCGHQILLSASQMRFRPMLATLGL